MVAILSLFSWLPVTLQALFSGGFFIFILWCLFRLVVSIVRVITDLIPGW